MEYVESKKRIYYFIVLLLVQFLSIQIYNIVKVNSVLHPVGVVNYYFDTFFI